MELVRAGTGTRLRYVPFQDEARSPRFGVPVAGARPRRCTWSYRTAVCIAGADAAPEILKLLPGERWLAVPFAVPE